MAKKRSGTSKSQSIRDHLKANPSDMPKQIIAALAKQGIKVSNGLVSYVKYTKTTGKKKGAKRTVKRKLPSAQTVDLAALQAAAKFVATVGDADTAIAAVRQVASLQIG
jgi:hypothetical protein